MAIVNKKTPLYQIFPAPEIYSFVWGLSPDLRDDNIYKIILENRAPQLLEIPWARTGLIYPYTEGVPDSFKKDHHNYGEMIRKFLLDDALRDIKNNKAFLNLETFNMSSINRLTRLCKRKPLKGYFYEEKLLWLSALSSLVEKFDIKGTLTQRSSKKRDFQQEMIMIMEYMAKSYIR